MTPPDAPLSDKEIRNLFSHADRFKTFEVLRALAERGSRNSQVAVTEMCWLNEVKTLLLKQIKQYREYLRRDIDHLQRGNIVFGMGAAIPLLDEGGKRRLAAQQQSLKELDEVLSYVEDPPIALDRPGQAPTQSPGPG